MLIGLLLSSPQAWPDDVVYRCEDAQGRRVFADQPCRAFGALPLPSDGDPPPAPPALGEGPLDADHSETFDLTPPAAANGCVGGDPEQLAAGLAAAIEQSDLNGIAGLFHWPSAGAGTAARVFATAQRLVNSAPVEVALAETPQDDAWLWAGLPPPSGQPLPELRVLAADGGDRLLQRFSLVQHAGCVWLRP